MFYIVTTWAIPDSADGEINRKAMEWSKKMGKYTRSKWPEIEFEMFGNYDGAQNDIHFKGKHESVAAWDKFMELFWQDDGIKSLLDELVTATKAIGAPLLVNRRVHFYRIVELD